MEKLGSMTALEVNQVRHERYCETTGKSEELRMIQPTKTGSGRPVHGLTLLHRYIEAMNNPAGIRRMYQRMGRH